MLGTNSDISVVQNILENLDFEKRLVADLNWRLDGRIEMVIFWKLIHLLMSEK
jgi:hypothetical protein